MTEDETHIARSDSLIPSPLENHIGISTDATIKIESIVENGHEIEGGGSECWSAESLREDIRALSILLRAKQKEWDNVLRLKKLKEILLATVLRSSEIESIANNTNLNSLLSSLSLPHLLNLVEITESRSGVLKESSAAVEDIIHRFNNEKNDKIDVIDDKIIGGLKRQYLDEGNNGEEAKKIKLNSNLSTMTTTTTTTTGRKGQLIPVSTLIADYRAKNPSVLSRGRRSRVKESESEKYFSSLLMSIAQNFNGLHEGGGGGEEDEEEKSNLSLTLAKLLSTSPCSSPKETVPKAKKSPISLSNLLATHIPKETVEERVGKSGGRSSPEEKVPICQGCNHNKAQFVCAGCGNQWYCSRNCQVEAWEEHAETCST